MKAVLIILGFLGVIAFSQAVIQPISDDFRDIVGKTSTQLADFGDLKMIEIPASINWTALGAVSPPTVKGNYLNSWAFAVAGVLESRHFIKYNQMTILSKQNLIDCCWNRRKLSYVALSCIERMGGIATEESYPFHGPIEECRFNKTNIGTKIIRNVKAGWGSEVVLAWFVAHGPVAADISYSAIEKYEGGILKDVKCDNTNLYSVLVVGYGTSKDGDYWILKTAMGSSWGEGGYMRLALNKQNLCGITNWAYYPEVL